MTHIIFGLHVIILTNDFFSEGAMIFMSSQHEIILILGLNEAKLYEIDSKFVGIFNFSRQTIVKLWPW